MKVLIIGNFHHKNKEGLEMILKHLKWGYKYGFGNVTELKHFDIIYSPSNPINTSLFPKKKFIFGPHFSVFPNNKLLYIKNKYNNSFYIQPSYWAANVWKKSKVEKYVPLKVFSFPVNTKKFKPKPENTKDKVFIYFKRRKISELNFLKKFLKDKNIDFTVFDYVQKYNEEDYLHYLQNAKYGIVLDAHESQGFAIEEALSCDVPLLVWNVSSMSQEEGINYPDIPATSIPYWDKRCGEYFYNQEEFKSIFDEFISKLNTYKPREFILENLSVEKCSEKFKNLIKF